MNSQTPDFDYVEAPRMRQGPPRFSTTETAETTSQSARPRNGQRQSLGLSWNGSSIAPPAPSPPPYPTSGHEPYGPDYFPGPPQQDYGLAGPMANPGVNFDAAQLAMFAAENAARMQQGIKDELTIAAGRVTPGVDDTPYIRYALAAMTGDQGGSSAQHFPSGTSGSYREEYSPPRRQQEQATRHIEPASPQHSFVEDQEPIEEPLSEEPEPQTAAPGAPMPQGRQNAPQQFVQQPQNPDPSRWDPVDKEKKLAIAPKEHSHPPLTYKPRILRPFSMLILMVCSALMAAALIFSIVYSDKHDGLTAYPGTIYSGQYFVFRILPQLLAAVILIYAQSIVIASFRVLPFCAMAEEDPYKRQHAVFQRLYPKSFLWPQMTGPWQVQVFGFATWLMNFTIPLQSATFTCILVSGDWSWATVPGVAWALVALYIIMLISTACLMAFWFRRWTGLVWDVRSIGDLMPLLHHSNAMEDYEGMDLAEGGENFVAQLRDRELDRLGYWKTEGEHSGAVWYAIGASANDIKTRQESHPIFNIKDKRISFGQSDGSRYVDIKSDWYGIRHRYLPPALRSSTLIAFFTITTLLLLALLIISFLPQTRLDRGFNPQLPARPTKGAFSAANFLYGFLPSLLGMVLFLLFQSLDISLRILQPWADFSIQEGSKARTSLLADYAACLPLQSTWRAAANFHWRVAIMSLMGVLFVMIPVLAGGLFIALTNPEREVRMFPNMPVFGVLLAFLFLYVGCISLMLPRRHQFRLPHPVTNLAEVISFCAASETYRDDCFRNVRSRGDLEGRLYLDEDNPLAERKWYFGTGAGGEGHRLSIRRQARFTEKRMGSPRSTI